MITNNTFESFVLNRNSIKSITTVVICHNIGREVVLISIPYNHVQASTTASIVAVAYSEDSYPRTSIDITPYGDRKTNKR
jgi:hypothetical protein